MMVRGLTVRAPLLLGLTIFAVLSSAAKCIEHEALYVDKDGYTHIVGVMTNETDVARLKVRRNLERRLRAIIDDNDFNILDVLLKNASQRPFGQSLAVENRYHC